MRSGSVRRCFSAFGASESRHDVPASQLRSLLPETKNPAPARSGRISKQALSRHLFAVVITILFTVGARAAPEPRSLVSIDRPVIRLKDLFHDTGPVANTILGKAPAPGNRILVETKQLSAIARQYGVAWKSDGSNVSTIIERPGVPIDQTLLSGALDAALRHAGAPTHSVVQLADNQFPLVPPNGHARFLVNRVDYDRGNGNFHASVLVTADGMNAFGIAIGGSVVPAAQVMVATHNLRPGEILNGADTRLAWIPRSSAPQGAITNPTRAIGMQVNRAISESAPISDRRLSRPTLVDRGATVELNVNMPGLEVTALGVALAAGGGGTIIPVLNPNSHEVVQAVIDGPNHAHVVPGSTPSRSRTSVPYYNMVAR